MMLDPQWFCWKNLSDEWRRKDVRGRALRLLTLLVVCWLSLNPAALSLATYVDSVGIDVALALLEMQLVVGLLLLLQTFCPRAVTWVGAAYRRVRVRIDRLRVFIAMLGDDASAP